MSRRFRQSATWFRTALILPALAPIGLACSAGQDGDENPPVVQDVQAVQSALSAGTISTDPNLKVAFIGDTADGNNWKAVLGLAQQEGAAAVVTAGDMTYTSDPDAWWAATEARVGSSFPVFLARGNHDDTSW